MDRLDVPRAACPGGGSVAALFEPVVCVGPGGRCHGVRGSALAV